MQSVRTGQGNVRVRTAVALGIALFLTLVASVASAAEVVVPNAQATAAGNSRNIVPFACDHITRYQQVYRGSEVGSGTVVITQIAFRLAPGEPPSTGRYGITMALSSTRRGPRTLSRVFARNVGADATTVFSGELDVSSAGGGSVTPPTPAPFDIVIPLQVPFVFHGGAGKNLLLDGVFSGCAEHDGDDAAYDAEIARGFSSVSATLDGVDDPSEAPTGHRVRWGLITQFTTAP